MGTIKVGVFGGMIPAVDDQLIPDSAAVDAQNCWLYSGALNGLPTPQVLKALTPGTQRAYRIPASYTNPRYLFDSTWLEFTNPDTDVIRAPVFGDTYDRYYWANSGTPPEYNTRARIDNGDDPWLLGVPEPATGMTVTPSGGSGSTVSRSYVYTYVTAYGEEGPPSVPTLQSGKVDDTWALASIDAPASTDDGGVGDDRNITHKRIYRTVTSSGGVATFFFVAEITAATVTYNDTALDSTITQNEQLQSTNWTGPPTDLQGFVVMPNGIVASWRSNEIWFSEPYRPHAWPAAYVQTVEYPIVGLGIVNQTLVVCTQGFPLTASGVHPSSITTSKLTSFEACLSRGSIISAPEGVYYASPNGLVLVSPGKIENATRNLITKDKWQQLTANSPLRAARLGTAYYAFGTIQAGVFEEGVFQEDAFSQDNYEAAFLGALIDPANERIAYTVLTCEEPMGNVYNDPWSGELFRIIDDNVEWLNQSQSDVQVDPYLWKSKSFQSNAKENFSAMRVFFQNPSGFESDLGTIKVYADGVLVVTHTLTTSGALMRIPSGFKADFWQFQIEGRVKVLSVQMGTSIKELRSV